MFYTYAYLTEDNIPYYIGSAKHRDKGNKYYRTLQRHYCDIPPLERILILKDNLTEEEAVRHETYLIYVFGRKIDGGVLDNLSVGGQGTKGLTRPQEERDRISKSRKGMKFSDSHRDNLRTHMIGKKMWNNGTIMKYAYEQPGPEWKRGRL